jgi:hypothetical protein
MATQTTITIKTRSVLIVHVRHTHRAWCFECSAEVEMVALPTPDVVAALDLAVHRCAGPDGSTLICLSSLLARTQQPPIGDAFLSPSDDKERT